MPPDNDVQQEIEQLEQRFAENAQGLVFAHLADAYRRAGEFAKAEGLLLHGLKNHPTYTSAYNVLGRVYLESERYADAHEQFSKVLELDPTNLIALQALGDLAARGGRLEDARSWYERMLQIDPRSKEAKEGMASLEVGGEQVDRVDAAEAVAGDEEPSVPAGELPAAIEPSPVTGETEPPPIPESGESMPDEFEAPWDFSELLAKGSPGASGEPVEDSVLGGGVSSGSESEDVSAAEAAPWESGFGEAAAGEGHGETAAGEAADGEGAELESAPVQGASFEGAAGGGGEVFNLDDLDFGMMDDWTPGLGSETPPGAETFETDSILESLGDALDIDLGGGFEEDEEAEEPEVSRDEPVVTETMAELYVGQGLYADALDVYRRLAEDRPNDERLRQRIAELEEKLSVARPEMLVGEDEPVELVEPTQPISSEPFAPVPGVVEPEVIDTDSEMYEEAEPVADEEATFSLEDLGPSETPVGDFEFEDEAPIAGMEQLDPFAVSFDAFALGSMPSKRAAEEESEEGAAEEPVAAVFGEEESAEEEPVAAVFGEEEAAEVVVEEESLEVGAEDEAAALVEEEPRYAAAELVADDVVIEEATPEVGEGIIAEGMAEEAQEVVIEAETVEAFSDDVDEGAVEVTVEPTDIVAEEEVPVSAFGIDEAAVYEAIAPEAEEEEEVVEDVIVEEPPAEPILASAEEAEDSASDRWELAVDDVGSELAGEDFGAEVVVDAGEDETTVEALADFEASELVADFAPPEPEPKPVPEVEAPEELTIESYLTGLLAYDPESAVAGESAEETTDAGEVPSDSDAAGPEDLEQFQNWLRSLKR